MRILSALLSFFAMAGLYAAEPGAVDQVARLLDATAPATGDADAPAPAPGEGINPRGTTPPAATADARTAPPVTLVRVTAHRQTVLSSQASGRVEELSVRDGESFAAGQTLLRLDDALALSQVRKAEALLRRQEALREMVEELVRLGSRGELEGAVARAEAEQAAADLDAARTLLERTRLRAPYAGRVSESGVREMQYVSEGQALLEIVDDADLRLEFIAPSSWIAWFRPGHAFSVTIDETGRSLRAELERLGGKVDPVSQSVKAYARLLDADPELMVGMSGAAAIAPPVAP